MQHVNANANANSNFNANANANSYLASWNADLLFSLAHRSCGSAFSILNASLWELPLAHTITDRLNTRKPCQCVHFVDAKRYALALTLGGSIRARWPSNTAPARLKMIAPAHGRYRAMMMVTTMKLW
jgi:hypothetical protein